MHAATANPLTSPAAKGPGTGSPAGTGPAHRLCRELEASDLNSGAGLATCDLARLGSARLEDRCTHPCDVAVLVTKASTRDGT